MTLAIQDIDELEPGVETDKIVAEAIRINHSINNETIYIRLGHDMLTFSPSTDSGLARDCAELFLKQQQPDDDYDSTSEFEEKFRECNGSPLAICKAILKLKG